MCIRDSIQCSQNYFVTGRCQFGLCRQYSMGGAYTGVAMYENDIDNQLKHNSELKYIEWKKPIDIWEIRRFYKYRREIEFLQKIKARQIVYELMYSPAQCDMRIMNEKWLRKHKHEIKNSDFGFEKIILDEKIRGRNGKPVPGAEKYISHVNFDKIPICIGIIRFQNWAIKNQIDFRYYIDYLKLMEQCNVPTVSYTHLSDEMQAISRIYRMGQVNHVFVYRLLAADTIDEILVKRLHDKQEIFDQFADESEMSQNLEQFEEADIQALIP